MSDANMQQLVVINALAVMAVHGVAAAVKYMQASGMSTNEAFNVLDAYDVARNRCLAGLDP